MIEIELAFIRNSRVGLCPAKEPHFNCLDASSRINRHILRSETSPTSPRRWDLHLHWSGKTGRWTFEWHVTLHRCCRYHLHHRHQEGHLDDEGLSSIWGSCLGWVARPQQKNTIPKMYHIWVFLKIMVPQNGWFIMEKPYEQMDDLGGKTTPIFGLTPIYTSKLGFLACEAWRSSSDSETTFLNKDPYWTSLDVAPIMILM